MKKRTPTVSPSQLDAMSCRFAWHMKYREGYSAKRSSMALEFGTGIHEALEFYYKDGKDPAEHFETWAERRISEMDPQWADEIKELEESKELGVGMLRGYVEEYKGKDDFDVIATEQTLSRKLPVPGTGTLSKCEVVIRLDGLVREHRTGNLFALEHKTFTRFNPAQLETDHQFTAQVWVGQSLAKQMGLDEPIVGVIYNGLRKQLPGPRVKQNLFERHKIYRTERQIEVFLHRAYWQYREMNKDNIPIYPQPNGIRCGQCDLSQVCTEYQRGGDWKFILNEFFVKRRRG